MGRAGVASYEAGGVLRAEVSRPRPGKPELPPRARRPDFRKSRFVAVMKRVLPGVALALLALIAAWPSLRQVEDVVRLTVTRATIAAADPRMIGPRLLGVDRSEQAFTVTADAAARLPGAGAHEIYELAQPKADITLKDGTWWAMSANKGLFLRDQQVLELIDEVSVYQDHGYEFVTSAARIDLAQKTASGDRPIRGHGPFGVVEAEGFRFTDQGQRFEFSGKTRLTLAGRKDSP